MKRFILIGLMVLVSLLMIAATPTPPPTITPIPGPDIIAQVGETPVFQEIPEILSQLIVIFGIPALAVLIGNLAKFPFLKKWLDGKTDKVVTLLTTIAFVGAVYLKIFDQELLARIMPWLSTNLVLFVNVLNVIIGWALSVVSIPKFHEVLEGKFIIGRSFTATKKE